VESPSQHAELSRNVDEHVKLLRSASRGKLFFLSLAVVVTWGLWGTLQAGDQRMPSIQVKYDGNLADLKKKWKIPADSPIGYGSNLFDVFNALAQERNPLSRDIPKETQFIDELNELRQKYNDERGLAYLVRLKMPYLVEPVEVSGLTLADWWPFALASILGAAIVLGMRERVNAIVLTSLADKEKSLTTSQSVIIRSDFHTGTLVEVHSSKQRYLVFRRPTMVHPESLVIYALVGTTVYLSFSFESSYNAAATHEMSSVLVDYLAAVWFFLIALVTLLLATRRDYIKGLERFIGVRVRGRTGHFLQRLSGVFNRVTERARLKHTWLGSVYWLWNPVLAILGLACLTLPWMIQGRVRGYRFLLSQASQGIDPDLLWEFRVQLTIAVTFVCLCLLESLGLRRANARLSKITSKSAFGLGMITLVLGGNLAFHFAMLEIAAESGVFFWKQNSGVFPAYPIKESSLISADPAYGFWAFLLICLALTIRIRTTVKRSDARRTRRETEV
jgi:hypothetical protein